MKLILHIGAHKTGTTSIQSFLNKNNVELSNQGWELVKVNGVINLGNCIDFNRDAGGKAIFEFYPHMYELLLASLKSSNKNKIISSEDLFFLNSCEHIKMLCTDLNQIFDDITIVLYLRNQVEMAISNKAQGAKTNQSALVFGNDYKNPLPPIDDNVYEYLDYRSKIQQWKEALPNARFVIRKYDRLSLQDGDSVADFVEAASLPLVAEETKANDSIGSILTNILHGMRKNGLDSQNAWDLFRLGFFNDVGGKKQAPSRGDAISFMKPFEASNKIIKKEFGVDLSLNEKKFPKRTEIQELDNDTVFVQMSSIINRLMSLRGDRDVDIIRDSAIALEDKDLQKAHDLMSIAHSLRPNGPFIREKLRGYKERLDSH